MDNNERNKMLEVGDKVYITENGAEYVGLVDSVYENPVVKEIQYTIEIPRLQEFKVCLIHELKEYNYKHISSAFTKRK